MIRTLFLIGPTDAQGYAQATSTTPQEGMRVMTAKLNGVLPMLPWVMNDPMLSANSQRVLVGIDQIRLPHNPRVNLFNLVADADTSPGMLHKIQQIANQVRPQRFFNQPGDVFKTSRGRLPATLADIPGCLVPQTELAHPDNLAELKALCHDFDRWPLILRARGQHGGRNMLLLSDAAQLDTVNEAPWLYQGIYLIEFIDYQNSDGLYQKNRVILVDGVPYPRHALLSDQWLVHAGSRDEFMKDRPDLCQQEEAFLETCVEQYGQLFGDIHQRIGLDIFGIDFAVVNDQLLIFEANACMFFLDRKFGNDCFQYLDNHVRKVRRAVKKMLTRS